MQYDLPLQRQKAVENESVRVSTEKQHLEDQHASRPYSRATTKPRQNVLCHNGLHLKEQERTKEDRGCKQDDRKAASKF